MKIVLTFDDGPHAAEDSQTLKIANELANNKCVGAFFVQTGISYRMGNPRGTNIVSTLFKQGHLIGIHTGVPDDALDHVKYPRRYKMPAWDVNGDKKITLDADGANALESDLRSAKQKILLATGHGTAYVRATGGDLGNCTMKANLNRVFSRLMLKHVYWNVDSGDSTRAASGKLPDSATVLSNLRKEIPKYKSKTALIVLFHDISSVTTNHLGGYLKEIRETVRKAGENPEFVATRAEIANIFDAPSGWAAASDKC